MTSENIQPNSIDAYLAVLPNLTKKQKEVSAIFVGSEKHTAAKVAEILNKPINQITPRLNELVYNQGVLVIAGCSYESGRKRSLYRLRIDGEFRQHRAISNKEKLDKIAIVLQEANEIQINEGFEKAFFYLKNNIKL